MGTNYYWCSGKGKCGTCGHSPGRPLHIGKSSAGWCFGLHVTRPGDRYPEEDGTGHTLPQDLDGWVALFHVPGSYIYDEYGELVTVEDMLDTITKRSRSSRGKPEPWWYEANQAQPGPGGLARHSAGGKYGAQYSQPGPPDETWDFCYGEFR